MQAQYLAAIAISVFGFPGKRHKKTTYLPCIMPFPGIVLFNIIMHKFMIRSWRVCTFKFFLLSHLFHLFLCFLYSPRGSMSSVPFSYGAFQRQKHVTLVISQQLTPSELMKYSLLLTDPYLTLEQNSSRETVQLRVNSCLAPTLSLSVDSGRVTH